MYGIKCGREWVKGINPVSGLVWWTRHEDEAKQFRREDAERYAEGIGRAVKLFAGYHPAAGMPQRGVWTDD